MSNLLLKARMSEKAYGLSQTRNAYVFMIPTDTNKLEVVRAVAEQFKVKVEAVRVANVKGKPKRTIRKGRSVNSSRSDMKKAYVTLKAGDTLPIFAAIEAEDAKQEAAAKKAKKEVKS